MRADLIFVGFNSRVAALDRSNGETRWSWKSPKGSGYVTVLLDGDRLIVSVQGYTYCLDPASGEQRWFNELPGMGSGVATLASARGGSSGVPAQAAAEEAARQSSDAGTSAAHG